MAKKMKYSAGGGLRWAIAPVALAGALLTSVSSAAELTVYSTTDADNLKIIAEAFQKSNPDIKINWLRDSTGIIAARVLAEKDNPKADAIFALAATSMLALAGRRITRGRPKTARAGADADAKRQRLCGFDEA